MVMYRYTEQKKQQANRKFAAKQRQRRQSAPRVTRSRPAAKPATPVNRSRRRARTTKTQTSGTSKKAKLAQKRADQFFSWLALGFSYLMVGLLIILLLVGIYLTLMNNLLPQLFALDAPQNVLLLGSDINGRPDLIYLLRFDPIGQQVHVYTLAPDIEVELVGRYETYPLSSVGALVSRYGDDLQEVQAAYNFALGQVLDGYYFLPELTPVTTRADLQATIGKLVRQEWARTGQASGLLWRYYFAVRAAKFVDITPVMTREALQSLPMIVGRAQLLKCRLWIYNAAAANGLARRVKNILESGGVSVIKLETAAEKLDQSVIYYDQVEPDCQRLVEILQQTLPRGVEKIPDGGERARRQRAGAILYLGEELAN